jgi:DNA adenine methylase
MIENVGPEISVKPFLKWAGGKTSLLQEILPLIPTIDTECCYWEPFVGSASIFFSVKPAKAVLSDLNSKLIGCYKAVRDYPDDVYDFLRMHYHCHSGDHYYKVREQFNRSSGLTEQAARFIYLNKACFNGLYRENKKAEFNVPYGKRAKPAFLTLEELKSASLLLRNAELIPSSFEFMIENIGRGDFVYCDPPYTVMHENNGFIKYNARLFSWEDQKKLRLYMDELTMRGAKVLISNAAHSSIRELYHDFDIVELTRSSCISANKLNRVKVSEYLIKNY